MPIAAFTFDINKITAYFNIALVVIFLLFILGILGAFWRGLKRGVWKSTHNMIFMFSLVIIAVATLDPFCKFVENFDISLFFKGSFIISKVVEGETYTYYVPISSIKATVTEFIQALYYMFNVSTTATAASNFAFAIAESVIKILLFIVDILLILIFGNLLSLITWYAFAQHIVPKVARKLVRLRWVGAIETAVTFIVMTALFCLPLTSLVNSLNQSYQHNKPKSDNEIVMNIGNFVDAYNNSLFAQILFNWTYDPNTGMTIDTRLFDTFTTGISGDVAVGLVGELANWTNIVIIGANGITSSEEGQFAFNAANLVTQEIADAAFDVLANSDLVTNILPVVVDIALNSSVLENIIPSRLIDLSDVEWKHEIGYMREMVDCLFESGVLDKVKDSDFTSFEGETVVEFIENIINDKNFNKALDVFRSMDESKILSRVIPAVVYYLVSLDTTGQVSKYIPLSWEELNEFSWGYECYILFDFLHSVATMDSQFLKVILQKTGSYTPKEGEELKSLGTLISEHVDDFNDLIVGKFGDDGNPINVDKYGRTIVFDKGQRIEGRNYCLFDMMTIDRGLPIVINGLYELDFMSQYLSNVTDEDRNMFHDAVSSLNEGVRLKNFKKEFRSVLDIIGCIGKDAELMDVFTGGGSFDSLMTEPGNFFSIDVKHINHFKEAVEQMDNSKLIYSMIAPMVKSFIANESFGGFLNDIGLRSDVIVDAINQDSKKANHEFFGSFATILGHWSDLAKIYSLTATEGDIMEKFKDSSLVDVLVDLLTIIYENPMLNPTPEPGNDSYEKNENLYGLLEFVFGMASGLGLEVTREDLRKVESVHPWPEEFAAIGNILKHIASHDVMNASKLFTDGLTRTSVGKLNGEGEGDVNLPALFKLVDDSYIFSSKLGSFLDTMFGDALDGFLISESNHVSFANIVSWAEEGEKISNLLTSLTNIIPEDDAKAKTFLSNFDLSTLKDIVELNDMLHDLAHSGVFVYIDENGASHYQFGAWFYQKVNDSMKKVTINSKEYDLLADPKPSNDATWSWDTVNWGVKPGEGENEDPYYVQYKNTYDPDGTLTDTHYIAYRDFLKLNGYDSDDDLLPTYWCNYAAFTTLQKNFLDAHKADLTNPTGPYLTNDWGAYFASDQFISDYDTVFAVDEISRVCKFMTYSLRIFEKCVSGPYAGQDVPFNKFPSSFIGGLLTTANDTCCLRASLYNFYNIASENLLNDYSAFDMTTAYNAYIVSANYALDDFEHGRPARQAELDYLVGFYDVIDRANTKGVISGGNFDFKKMKDEGFLPEIETLIKDLNSSYIFHRLGASKKVLLTNEEKPTCFQSLFNTMLTKSSMKDTIYLGDLSPKDQAATEYTDADSKVTYLVKHAFLTDRQITDAYASQVEREAARTSQINEISDLMTCIDKIYSLKNKTGDAVTSINDADLSNNDNIANIEILYNKLNNSELLYDCVPNSIYNIFIKNDQLSITSGDLVVDFKRVDPYYHYYYNGSLARDAVKYDAKYLPEDIDSIVELLRDYSLYNTTVGTSSVTNKTVLASLTTGEGALTLILKDMHNSYLFHTPARNRPALATYWTNKYQSQGFTLFEEMVSKICGFVKLDDFAYDSAHDSATYATAAAKLKANIKALTAAEDGLTDAGTNALHYHYNNHGWAGDGQEIDAIMALANASTSLGTGDTVNMQNFALKDMAPNDIKVLMTRVNNSDIIYDAVPNFVKKGFDGENLNLVKFFKYDSHDYANYYLGQKAYGGNDGLSGAGTEINEMHLVLSALHNGTSYMDNIGDIKFDKAFMNTHETVVDAFMTYIYNSKVLNTSQTTNVYDEYNLVDGRNISAQGVMLKNLISNDLSSYIARDADKDTAAKVDIDKIASLSKMVHMRTYGAETPHIETQGIKNLVNEIDGKIDASSFATNDINIVKGKRETIMKVVQLTYDAYDTNVEAQYKRSVIVSEFTAGVFNNILENEYGKLDTSHPTYVYDKGENLFSFGNDNAATLTFDDYSSLNSIEKDGVDGMLRLLNYVTKLNTLTNEEKSAMRECFTLMGAEPGNNSKLSQIIYLCDSHPNFDLLDGTTRGTVTFVAVDETSNDRTLDNNVYSNTFSFDAYGGHVYEFVTAA